MRRTLLVAGLLGALTSMALAAPASAATYSVSLSVSRTKADVGQTVRLTGTVSGSKAARKTVLVQRKVGSGSWRTIARPRTTSRRTYSVTHRVSAVGAQQFRVVAPRKGSTRQGLSSTRAFTGWTWLLLDRQPMTVGGFVGLGTVVSVSGRTYRDSIDLHAADSGTSGATWFLDGQCDRADIPATVAKGTSQVEVDSNEGGGGITTLVAGAVLPIGNVTLGTGYLSIYREAGAETISLLRPRLHCDVARLSPPPAL
jgi:hypothetical protein